jgi:hypothetical protein
LPDFALRFNLRFKVKISMRFRVVIFVGVLFLFVLCCLGAFILTKPPFLQFMDKGQKYYVELSRACDTVLQQHPRGTNEFIALSGEDASLPSVIRDLHSNRITVENQRLWMVIGGSRDGFGVAWERDESRMNLWRLIVYPDGEPRVAYAETR